MKTKAMLIAAHPDDAEIAMGGTIAAFTEKNKGLVVVDLTNGEPTPFGSPEIRKQESAEASRILGIKERLTLDIPNRDIQDNLENRLKLANIIREHKPDTLFIPYWEDAHPDHVAAHNLCMAARFYSKFSKSELLHAPHYPQKVFHYFSLHMRAKILPSFIFDISPYFAKKMQALKAYKSQFEANPKNAGSLKLFETENAYWGSQIGVTYGEPFVCRENIKISDPSLFFDI